MEQLDSRKHASDLFNQFSAAIGVHKVQSRSPIRGHILLHGAGGTTRLTQSLHVSAHAEVCIIFVRNSSQNRAMGSSLPAPWIVCTCPDISPESTIGSKRATPVRPRQGRRQNALVKTGKMVRQAPKTAVRRMSCILQWYKARKRA